jgi:hypothetical protein
MAPELRLPAERTFLTKSASAENFLAEADFVYPLVNT